VSGDAAVVWLAIILLIACVLFRGEPDIVDAIRERVTTQRACTQPEVE
jgi:hypothetical protein